MYQLTTGTSIIRLTDGAFIPNDPGNRDYREYLEYLEAGNAPEPAPAPPVSPVLTTEQKLEVAGLTVVELKKLF
jgi:hypothetical protein